MFLYRTGRSFEEHLADRLFSKILADQPPNWHERPIDLVLALMETFNWFGKLLIYPANSTAMHVMCPPMGPLWLGIVVYRLNTKRFFGPWVVAWWDWATCPAKLQAMRMVFLQMGPLWLAKAAEKHSYGIA